MRKLGRILRWVVTGIVVLNVVVAVGISLLWWRSRSHYDCLSSHWYSDAQKSAWNVAVWSDSSRLYIELASVGSARRDMYEPLRAWGWRFITGERFGWHIRSGDYVGREMYVRHWKGFAYCWEDVQERWGKPYGILGSHVDDAIFLSGTVRTVVLPFWCVTILAWVIPSVSLFRRGMRWRRRRVAGREGRCLRCGYDLRATPQRCPECGTVVEGKA